MCELWDTFACFLVFCFVFGSSFILFPTGRFYPPLTLMLQIPSVIPNYPPLPLMPQTPSVMTNYFFNSTYSVIFFPELCTCLRFESHVSLYAGWMFDTWVSLHHLKFVAFSSFLHRTPLWCQGIGWTFCLRRLRLISRRTHWCKLSNGVMADKNYDECVLSRA